MFSFDLKGISTKSTVIVGSLCLAYVALRFWGLVDSCLWFDEIFSIHAAEHSWDSILWFVARDLIHPPLFYLLLKIWITIGGEGLLWLRSLPVVFSVLALFPFLMLCKELKLKFEVIAVSLAFLAINGALIKYSQELRMYSLVLFVSLVSIWLFARFLMKGKSFVLLVLVNILLVYTHYFGWLVVLSQILAIVIFQRIKLRQILLMFGIVFSSFIPWAVAVIRAVNAGSDVNQNIGWVERPGLLQVFDLAFDLVEPFYFQASNAEPISLLYISIPILLIVATAKIVFLSEWKGFDEKNPVYLLLIFATVPVAIAFVASWALPVSVWGSRHLIIVFPPAMILTGIVLNNIKWNAVKIGLLSALGVIVVAAFAVRLQTKDQVYIWCGWEPLAHNLQADSRVEALPTRILVFEDLVAYHFWFAVRDLESFKVVRVKGIEGLVEDSAYFIPRGFNDVEISEQNSIEGGEFYVVFRDSKWDTRHPPLSVFAERGYKFSEPIIFDAGNQKAFLLKAKKTVTR